MDHDLLLTKLAAYGFKLSVSNSHSINWMKIYLSNRQQSVMFNGTFSSMKALHCGIPQGSCLGPLLYSIFVNDMTLILQKAHSVMYADDTTIYASTKNIIHLSSILQNELMQISEWVTENKLKLNVSKTKCLVICSRNAQRGKHRLCVSLLGIDIEQVGEAKLLGVAIDETLSWATQINNIITKMSRSISIIRRSAFFLANTARKQVIQSLVMSHLDYCPEIWSTASKQELNKIQLTQNRAARLALHCSERMLKPCIMNCHG